jgi:DNA-binding HxlR family transcriptional regulator
MSREQSDLELRIKVGSHEIEVKGQRDDVMLVMEKAIEYVNEWSSLENSDTTKGGHPETDTHEDTRMPPTIEITQDDTAVSIIEKLFSTRWANEPKSLNDIMQMFKNLGVHYPKSTVAVTLRRLVKRGRIRRVKSDENVYVYLPATLG